METISINIRKPQQGFQRKFEIPSKTLEHNANWNRRLPDGWSANELWRPNVADPSAGHFDAFPLDLAKSRPPDDDDSGYGQDVGGPCSCFCLWSNCRCHLLGSPSCCLSAAQSFVLIFYFIFFFFGLSLGFNKVLGFDLSRSWHLPLEQTPQSEVLVYDIDPASISCHLEVDLQPGPPIAVISIRLSDVYAVSMIAQIK